MLRKGLWPGFIWEAWVPGWGKGRSQGPGFLCEKTQRILSGSHSARKPGTPLLTWHLAGRGHLGRYLGEIVVDQHLILRAE